MFILKKEKMSEINALRAEIIEEINEIKNCNTESLFFEIINEFDNLAREKK